MIKIKKLRKNAKTPFRATPGSAGADLFACLDDPITIMPKQTILVPTGLAMEIPSGYVGLVFARSGLATKQDLAPANKVAVIDADYRGEWLVPLHNHGNQMRIITPDERIAQMVVVPCLADSFEVVDELSDTERGAGGFGSTGIKGE